jgi:hypothetical protein
MISQANITDSLIRENHVQVLKGEKVPADTTKHETESAKCSVCNKPVSEKVKAFCLVNKKFNGKIYCFDHQAK